MTHRKKEHDIGCEEGWFIPTHPRRALGVEPACFLSPFLNNAHLTNNVRTYLTRPEDSWWKTTAEWEEFMIQAEVAWHAHLVEQQQQAGL